MEGGDCIFCKIIRGEIPSYKVYEDENFLAFLDIAQFTKGHTVVVPKKHVEFVWDVDDVQAYFSVVRKIANHFRSLGYKYVDSMSFGRVVPHSHVHLIPHNDENGDYKKALGGIGDLQTDKTRWPTPEEGEEIAKKFRL